MDMKNNQLGIDDNFLLQSCLDVSESSLVTKDRCINVREDIEDSMLR